MSSYFEWDPAFEENTAAAEVVKNDGNEDMVSFYFQADISLIYTGDRIPLFSSGYSIPCIRRFRIRNGFFLIGSHGSILDCYRFRE
jgi:hypothetical protein